MNNYSHNAIFKVSIIFLCFSVLVVFVPFFPKMPSSGLDASWRFAINEAVARGLVFGKDIIFTFGPYGSIYTMEYHPATVHLMIIGSSVLACCYVSTLLLLSSKISSRWLFILGILFAFFMASRDALLFSYPLLLILLIFRITLPSQYPYKITLSKFRLLIFSFLFIPLGLLPLIKSSLIIICGITLILCSSMLLFTRNIIFALLILSTCTVSGIIFWQLASQPLTALPDFYINSLPIISGYTNAMSIFKKPVHLFLYSISSFTVLLFIFKIKPMVRISRIFLLLGYSLFLFIAFKAGFVRHDSAHAYIAGTSLAIAVLSLVFISEVKPKSVMLILSFIAFCVIGKSNTLNNAYTKVFAGIKTRLVEPNTLNTQFINHINLIKNEYSIPPLTGSVDIYPFHQSYLLASNNRWSPRPVLQSYSAYTGGLATMDANYLSGERAPDNILFSIETIDHRLPSLDSGSSWQNLVNHYAPTIWDERFIYLKKKPFPYPAIEPVLISNEIRRLGEAVLLPDIATPLLAEIEIKQTIIGKLATFLYQAPPLDIVLNLDNGKTLQFRMIPNMAKSGFLLSPLIENTNDFVTLITDVLELQGKKVNSFTIRSRFGGTIFWNKTYIVKLGSFYTPNNKPFIINYSF